MTQPTLPVIISSLLALTSASSFAASITADTPLAEEQHFVRGNGAEPNTLDPSFVNSGMPGDIIVNDMFEGFVIENSDGQIIPGQAESWTFSNGGKTVTFVLKAALSGRMANQSPHQTLCLVGSVPCLRKRVTTPDLCSRRQISLMPARFLLGIKIHQSLVFKH